MHFLNKFSEYFSPSDPRTSPSVPLQNTDKKNQEILLQFEQQMKKLQEAIDAVQKRTTFITSALDLTEESQEADSKRSMKPSADESDKAMKVAKKSTEDLKASTKAPEKDAQESLAPAAKSTAQVLKKAQRGSKTQVIYDECSNTYNFWYFFTKEYHQLANPFIREAKNPVRHPNMILVSSVKNPDNIISVRVDYMDGGALSRYTNSFRCMSSETQSCSSAAIEVGRESKFLSNQIRFLSSVIKQTAEGLHFLNTGKKRSHGNVTSNTIFLRGNGNVRLGLPGLLLPEVVKANPLHFVDTPFCAPELRLFIQNEIASKKEVDEKTWKEKYNEKSDVWALGVVICSQFLGKKMLPEWGEIDIFAPNSDNKFHTNPNRMCHLEFPTDQNLNKLREDYQVFDTLVSSDSSLNADLWEKSIPDPALRALAQGCLQVDPEKRWNFEKIVGFIHVAGGLLPEEQKSQVNEHSNLWASDYHLLTKEITFNLEKLSENEKELLKEHKLANIKLAQLLKRACELHPDQKTRTLELISGNKELSGIAFEIGKLLTEESEWIEKVYQESRKQNINTRLDRCLYDALKTRHVPANLAAMAKLTLDANNEISSTQNAKRAFLSDRICFPQIPIQISSLLKSYVDEIGQEVLNTRKDVSMEILEKIKQKVLKHFSSKSLENISLHDFLKTQVHNLMFGCLRDRLGGISSDDEEDNEPIRTIEQALSVNVQRAQRDLATRKKEPLSQRRQEKPEGLSKPIIEGGAGIVHAQGKRSSMEDEHLVSKIYVTKANLKQEIPIFAVLDGHGGNRAAEYAKNYLPNYLKWHLEREDEPFNAFKLALVDLENGFFKTHPQDTSGTTAAILIEIDKEAYVVNTGDSRVLILSEKKGYIQATEDADPTQKKYTKSVEKRGGYIFGGHVNDRLGVARSIGDSSFPCVTARPTITRYNLEEIGNSFFIICCDGIFETLSSKDILDKTKKLLDEGMSEEDVASAIVRMAYEMGSKDNLSVMVVRRRP